MPILIRHIGEVDAPIIVCDHCGKDITEARDGNYEWRMTSNDRSAGQQLYFTHKRCCHAFEQGNRGDFTWGAMGLDQLPLYLANNLKLNWEAARKSAEVFALI